METSAYVELSNWITALSGLIAAGGLLGFVFALLKAQFAISDEGKMSALNHAKDVLLIVAGIGSLGAIASWIWREFATRGAAGEYFLNFFNLF